MITLHIPGKPVGKGRPRFTKTGRTYTPQTTRDAEANIAWHAKAVMNRRPPLDGPVEVRAIFTFTDKRRRDVDNNLKLVLDAMNTIVYHDDNQVHRIEAEKRYGDTASTQITVQPA